MVGSALDAAAKLTAESVFEGHEASDAEEAFEVLLAVEGADHAGEVVGGGDGGSQPAAEGFARGAAAEVVPAAGAGRLGDEFELARRRFQLDHSLDQVG